MGPLTIVLALIIGVAASLISGASAAKTPLELSRQRSD
jgi:hypothetical protein